MNWHWLLGPLFSISGANNEAGSAYGFWSGFAGATGVWASPIIVGLAFYYHHTCHWSAVCLRWGHFPMAGGSAGKVCHKHHPEHQGRRPRGEMIHRLHAEWVNRNAA